MVSGEIRLYDPGADVDVDVVANSAGEVAGRGDPVELAGEEGARTQVQLAEEDGAAIGALKHDNHLDDEDDVDAGEVAGKSTVLADGPVDWYDEVAAEDLAVGDVVVLTGDGVRAYDDDPGDDTVDMQFGRVFATGTRATAATAEKVAVLRYK